MKRLISFSLVIIIAITGFGQKPVPKKGLHHEHPVSSVIPQQSLESKRGVTHGKISPVAATGKQTRNDVKIIPIGTSQNAYSYGFSGGQRTMVWADSSLETVINIHRMGPGSSPPGLDGYLAIDIGTNRGQDTSDWQLDRQIYAATLPASGGGFADAARFPQVAIYNPQGNTSLSNAWAAFFAPNLTNNGNWGGYSHGTANLANPSDTTKKLEWFNPPPGFNVPSGFTITRQGVALMANLDMDYSGAVPVYNGNIIVGRGIWNETTHNFDYTFSTAPLPTTDNMTPMDVRIAASPDGSKIWIVTLANNGGAIQIGDSLNLYPVVLYSYDGIIWSDPIAIQLDGPDGIDGVKNFISDSKLEEIYGFVPPRDEIPYTTAFDCDIAVDKWGRPNIGVVIGLSVGNYAILTEDSTFAVLDIYGCDNGVFRWEAEPLGVLNTFRGNFGPITEDNRVNVSTTSDGRKMFFTWNDTQIEGVTQNNQPDVFVRGFDLDGYIYYLTNYNSTDLPTNITKNTIIANNAPFVCASHNIFSDTDKFIIPIVTESLLIAGNPDSPVTFQYISNFSFSAQDFTIHSSNMPCYIPNSTGQLDSEFGISQNFPNPFNKETTVEVDLPSATKVSLTVTDLLGFTRLKQDYGFFPAGTHQLSINGKGLQKGIYFYTLQLGSLKSTKKMVVN